MLCFSVICIAVACGATRIRRGRVHEWLGQLGADQEAAAASVVASVVRVHPCLSIRWRAVILSRAALCVAQVGGISAQDARNKAQRAFRGIPFASLCYGDFTTNKTTGTARNLRDLTDRRNLGEVDVFLSHSWHDPADAKWKALDAWATQFEKKEGRSPIVWLDKACIDQGNINDSLACLPIFLAGCRNLLVVAGPSYVERLWCVVRLACFECAIPPRPLLAQMAPRFCWPSRGHPDASRWNSLLSFSWEATSVASSSCQSASLTVRREVCRASGRHPRR